MDNKRLALKYSSTADQSHEAARALVDAMFAASDEKSRADLLNYFAECHDFSANALGEAWGDPEAMGEENRLQLHMIVAGSAFFINLISEYLIEEGGSCD